MMADLVRGEASESDEEQDADKHNIFAAEVSGEATEEDEDMDIYEKSSSGVSATASMYRNNLLQRKLIENNVTIWRSLNALSRGFVMNASKQLLTTDQMLIKSQVSLQSANTALQLAQKNTALLQTKVASALSCSFLPDIKINQASS